MSHFNSTIIKIQKITIDLNYFFDIIKNVNRTNVRGMKGAINMNDYKTELIELINTLSDNQILFILTFLKRILGID